MTLKSQTEPSQGEAEFSGPCTHALGFPAVRNIQNPPRILALLEIGLPPAVIGAIRAIAIAASKSMIGAWFFSHVGAKIKCPHFAAPSFAYGNTATTVILVCLISFCVASAHHALPTEVSIGINSASQESVDRCDLGHGLFLEASAGAGMPAPNVIDRGDGFLAAVTPAQPERLGRSPVVNSYGDKPSEFLSGEIGYFRHNAVDLILSRCENCAGRLTTAMKELFGVSPYPAAEIIAV